MKKEKNNRRNKGITLIALIITIIVMLILVGVSVTVSLKGELFSTAKEAADGTQIAAETETLVEAVVKALKSDGTVDFDKLNNNLPNGFTENDGIYISGAGNKYIVEEEGDITLIKLPEDWEETTTPATWTKADGTLNDNVTAITDGTYTIPLPKGYTVSLKEGEDTVAGGLVITDGESEFVWIPLAAGTTFADTYTTGNIYRNCYRTRK